MKTVVCVLAALAWTVLPLTSEAATKKKAGEGATAASGEKGADVSGGGEGKVLQTLNSGGYTYLEVSIKGKSTWVACPETAIKKGATVVVPAGMAMRDFESASLKKTFPLIYFVSAVEVKGAKGAKAAAPQGPPVQKVVGKVTGVQRAEGGSTVAEILRDKRDFAGKDILVRAKVVKRSLGIMSKTWLHVQDGSGDQGTDDLVVTTVSEPEVGDVVLVKGKLTVDKDFGYGYRFEALIEDAEVKKE